ncbi:hypothetical protein BMR08_00705 [Methylococcaceae bacterium CS2]|nr:hypothetical protein BMR08_00705 [Methylococcaceae bacterium CS2]
MSHKKTTFSPPHNLKSAMDISPYIKLMVEKNADSLQLNVGSPPSLRLGDQEKAVGVSPLNSEILNKLKFPNY